MGLYRRIRLQMFLSAILIVGTSLTIGVLMGEIVILLIAGLVLAAADEAVWLYMWICRRQGLEQRGFRW